MPFGIFFQMDWNPKTHQLVTVLQVHHQTLPHGSSHLDDDDEIQQIPRSWIPLRWMGWIFSTCRENNSATHMKKLGMLPFFFLKGSDFTVIYVAYNHGREMI